MTRQKPTSNPTPKKQKVQIFEKFIFAPRTSMTADMSIFNGCGRCRDADARTTSWGLGVLGKELYSIEQASRANRAIMLNLDGKDLSRFFEVENDYWWEDNANHVQMCLNRSRISQVSNHLSLFLQDDAKSKIKIRFSGIYRFEIQVSDDIRGNSNMINCCISLEVNGKVANKMVLEDVWHNIFGIGYVQHELKAGDTVVLRETSPRYTDFHRLKTDVCFSYVVPDPDNGDQLDDEELWMRLLM